MAHKIIIIEDQIYILKKANIALAKCRKAKKIQIQLGKALSIEKSQAIINKKKKEKRPATQMAGGAEKEVHGRPSKQRYSNYSKTRHNTRIYKKKKEESSRSDSNYIIANPA